MTGKRPRALTRTASVSHLGSGNLSQEFSPLPENPTEKLKPSPPAAAASPRVVIGFDPKPADSPKSAPCSPCFNDKASSPRSVLNSLFSRQRCVKPSDGVGLGIALHDTKPSNPPAPATATATATATPDDDAHHIAVPASPRAIPVAHSRRHSHPIPTPGISACHFSHQTHDKPSHPLPQPAARPALGWLDHDALKVDRRDTFLLGASPSRSLPPTTTTTSSSSHFLDECSFCKRHLPEDKDIFMYRGDKAFCSVECRSQQMLMDERSKNCSSSALKKGQGAAAPSQRTRVAAASSVAAA